MEFCENGLIQRICESEQLERTKTLHNVKLGSVNKLNSNFETKNVSNLHRMSKDTMRTFPIETQMRKIGGKSKRNESKLDFGKRFYLKFEITL